MRGFVLGWFATVLLLSGAAAQELPVWKGLDGKSVVAELVGFDWDNKLLVLQAPDQPSPQMYPARNLELPGKLRLFVSRHYRKALAEHLESIRQQPHFQIRAKELHSLGVLMLSSYVVSFLGVSWLLAAWATQTGSMGKTLLSVLFVIGLSVGAVFGIFEAFSRFPGREQEILIAAAGGHFLIFFLTAVFLLRARLFRSLGWWVLHWSAAILLPVTLVLTALGAQVYKAESSLSLKAVDSYLMDTWFDPMGLL